MLLASMLSRELMSFFVLFFFFLHFPATTRQIARRGKRLKPLAAHANMGGAKQKSQICLYLDNSVFNFNLDQFIACIKKPKKHNPKTIAGLENKHQSDFIYGNGLKAKPT